MKSRAALLLLALTWSAGLLPVSRVGFEDRSLEVTLLEVAPAITAMTTVTTVLVGLAMYLRTSLVATGASAFMASAQWIPVLGISESSQLLLDKYAELSGVEISQTQEAPATIDIYLTVWLLPVVSLLLAGSLAILLASRLKDRRSQVGFEIVEVAAPSAGQSNDPTELWNSQLLESRAKKRTSDAG